MLGYLANTNKYLGIYGNEWNQLANVPLVCGDNIQCAVTEGY